MGSSVTLKVRRQDDPQDIPYWEEFSVESRPGMTVLDALVEVGRHSVAADGAPTSPVLFEHACGSGSCGACAMIICGRARLACNTFLAELGESATLEPLSVFPIVRDLRVDRQGMSSAIASARAWVDLDGVYEHGPPLRFDPVAADRSSLFSSCVMCGICAELCPQVNARTGFAGAFLFAAVLALVDHPLGRFGVGGMMALLAGRGGLSDCAGALACDTGCPLGIPLREGIARLQRLALGHAVKRAFGIE